MERGIMTTKINGDTGVSQCQPNSVSQDDLQSGVVGKGAYLLDASGTFTTTSGVAFAENTNLAGGTIVGGTLTGGRWKPDVAGLYQVSGFVIWGASAAGQAQWLLAKDSVATVVRGSGSNNAQQLAQSFGGLVSMNGTTDYLSFLVAQNSGGALNAECHLSGTLVRAA